MSTAARISSAAAPSTSTSGSSAGTPASASRAWPSSGRPSSSASCLTPPKRRPAPAASSSPPTPPLTGDLVDAPAGVGQPAALAAVAHGDDLAHDRERGLLRAERAEVEPDRRRDARLVGLGDAELEQAVAALGLRPARAHGADVGRLGARARSAAPRRRAWGRGSAPRSPSRGRSRPARRRPPPATPPRPARRRGSAAGWAKRARGSTTNGRQPTARAILHSWAAKSTAPKTNSRGGGNVLSTNSVAPSASRRSERSAHISSSAAAAAVASSSGEPSVPCRVPSGATRSLRAGIGAREHGDEGGAAIRARRVGEGGLRPAHGS